MRLLFDLDGTLTDPALGIVRSLAHALERLGEPPRPAEDLKRWIGPPLRESFAELLGSGDPELVERAVAAYREHFGSAGLFENRLYPGIDATLERLRDRGWELHVVTSKPLVYARKVLDHFGLTRRFGRVFGAELSGERSHKDELIRHALEELGAGSAGTWMVGDRSYDMAGARANGIGALGVLWGYGSRAELLDAGAERLFATQQELSAWAEVTRAREAGGRASGDDAPAGPGRASAPRGSG